MSLCNWLLKRHFLVVWCLLGGVFRYLEWLAGWWQWTDQLLAQSPVAICAFSGQSGAKSWPEMGQASALVLG